MTAKLRIARRMALDLRLFLFSALLSLAAAIYSEAVGHSTLVFIGSYNLTTAEPVLGASMVAAVTMVLRRQLHFDLRVLLLVVLAALTLVSFGRGLLVRPYDAFFSLRNNGPFTAMLFMACVLPPNEQLWAKVQKIIVFAGAGLAGLVFLRIVLGPTFLIQAQYLEESTINDGGRALSAQGAMIVGAAVLLQFRQACRQEHFALLSLCVLVPALLLTRQATATIATVSAVVTFFALQPGPSRPLRIWLLGFLLLMTIFFSTILPSALDPETLDSIAPKAIVGDTLRRVQTLDTRQLVWAGLLRDFYEWSFENQALGLPAGVKPVVIVPLWGGTVWKNSIHSMYFGLLPQVGVVGLLVYIAALFSLAFRSIVVSTLFPGFDGGAMIASLVVLLAVFGFSYELRGEAALFLLVAVQYARRSNVRSGAQMRRIKPRAKGRAEYAHGFNE
ncbi:hypothetical protein IVB33_07025 [Bradyrhizobium sp. 24]|uniref:hypothetical protein n=1 Tax=unclassified Bradyrhizobium TaxID=2631580 RepID=UPI001FFBBA93|nr:MULTISPECIES: hypothetical protein [unclassified Bradyrhizobium]MCK1297314.1 hypothetical protein [Bradyrhizobium sp. 37]MCK1378010.1 hypothetical protein [Bradyrhizobium sp. 24]MCK1769320.1 hypothetical protein [Bradyrhizobium sp. 134]